MKATLFLIFTFFAGLSLVQCEDSPDQIICSRDEFLYRNRCAGMSCLYDEQCNPKLKCMDNLIGDEKKICTADPVGFVIGYTFTLVFILVTLALGGLIGITVKVCDKTDIKKEGAGERRKMELGDAQYQPVSQREDA